MLDFIFVAAGAALVGFGLGVAAGFRLAAMGTAELLRQLDGKLKDTLGKVKDTLPDNTTSDP